MLARISPFSLCIIATLVCLFPYAAQSHSVQSGDITVGHVWAYPPHTITAQPGSAAMPALPGGMVIDVYGPLLNNGAGADAVTGIVSPAANKAVIVMWVRGNQMVRDFPLDLPPGKPVALGPQTQFLRLYGVSASYKDGDHVPITFHFAHVDDATIDVIVQGK